MEPTGIVRDPVYMMHDMGAFHPESPRRLEALYALLDKHGSSFLLEDIPAREAGKEELTTNHSPGYVDRIAATAGKKSTFLDPDTSTNAHSWQAASMAVGGLLNLVDAVVDGKVRNGFALVRPPGHHAEYDRAMGFCLFNNVAIAARHALSKHGMERIAIVDWDLHHGNGTQHAFYDDPKVLFISTHQYPYYPGTGSAKEVGKGQGEGYTVNVPLSFGAGDAEYLVIFHYLVAPVLESYKPDLILVSAGFDAHHRDPLGGMGLKEKGYDQMIRVLMRLASELCSGRLILTLEGGYDLTALVQSVAAILAAMSSYDPSKSGLEKPDPKDLDPGIAGALRDIFSVHKKYWPDLPLV